MVLQRVSGFSLSPRWSSSENVRADFNRVRVSTSPTTMATSHSVPARKDKERELRSRPFVQEMHNNKLRLQMKDRIQFDEYRHIVAREAQFDEECWTAAWLRAETHFEGREDERYFDSHMRRFAEQEFNAMKRRYNAQLGGDLCKCIVAVNKDRIDTKATTTVFENVVGTLDLSIGYLSQGQTFPGDRVKTRPLFYFVEREPSIRYGYIFNLCVAKSTRRRGVARRMLRHAILSAKANGAEKVFVHVHRDNEPAQALYQEMGFEVVDAARSGFADDQIELLCINLGYFTDN